ncbi:MAG TPA: hypothetical protein ENK28_00305, partial [Aliiroseovarius sp.]|nr:hypothetical protein [Aliiroseovarius sp.]
MSRILFVANATLGHIARLLTVASELEKTGADQITFALPELSQYADLIRTAGYELRTLPVRTVPVRTAKGNKLHLDLDTFSTALEELIHEINPAAIVLDFNQLILCAAMRWPKVPRILITNVFLTGLSTHTTVQGHMFPDLAGTINANRAAKGLPALESVTGLYEADLVCLADPDILVEQFAPLREYHRACGACYWESNAPLPAPLPEFDSAVLFSMGSTGETPIGADLVDAMKELSGADFAIYAGAGADALSSAGIVDYAAPMLPLQKIFPKVKLAVTQGGAGSTYQALSHGVPVIALPTHTNHEILGQALAQKGLVYCLPKSGVIPTDRPVNYAALAARARHFAANPKRKIGPAEIARHIKDYLRLPGSNTALRHP